MMEMDRSIIASQQAETQNEAAIANLVDTIGCTQSSAQTVRPTLRLALNLRLLRKRVERREDFRGNGDAVSRMLMMLPLRKEKRAVPAHALQRRRRCQR